MDGIRFDQVARFATESRRALLAATFAAISGQRFASSGEAKKKRRPKKRTVKQRADKPNAYGCIDVGKLCQNSAQCCSGICAGKKGKRTCRAHDVGDCQAGAEPDFCGVTDIACTTNGGRAGVCGTTTGNAGYCLVSGDCYACRTDLDCQRAGGSILGRTAACIQCFGCSDHGGTACVSTAPPAPMSQMEGHISFDPGQG